MSTAKHLINVLFLGALCVTVGHTCGHVSPTLRFQLVGFTSTTYTGDTGVLGFTLACQAEFPGSRMCTTEEVMETTLVPANPSSEAWVRPAFQGYSDPIALDASGFRAHPHELSCRGWASASSSTYFGIYLDSSGHIKDSGACSQPRSVSCCALLP